MNNGHVCPSILKFETIYCRFIVGSNVLKRAMKLLKLNCYSPYQMSKKLLLDFTVTGIALPLLTLIRVYKRRAKIESYLLDKFDPKVVP